MVAIDMPKEINKAAALEMIANSLNPPNDANMKHKLVNTIMAMCGVMYLL